LHNFGIQPTHHSMKNADFWDGKPRGSCKTHVLEDSITSIIRVTRISKLGTVIAVTSKRSTSQKMAFFIVITLKTSNRTCHSMFLAVTESQNSFKTSTEKNAEAVILCNCSLLEHLSVLASFFFLVYSE
jgi:hypothetical protein